MSKKSARKGKNVEAKADVTNEAVSEGAATENRDNAMHATEEEMTMLTRYRAAGEDCVKELGQLEQASQAKLLEIGKRLEIPEGTAWTVTPEGAVSVNPTPDMGESQG